MAAPLERVTRGPAATTRRAICTYFDSNYLSRGIVMLRSLLKREPQTAVYVLCLDETTETVLKALFGSRITTIQLQRLHEFDSRLPELRTDRSIWAFYATHKPAFLDYVMSECGPFQWVTFIDADTAFYSNLSPVFDEISSASIGLSPHRFVERDDPRMRYGRFNAGFICFRDDPTARRCLRDWCEECIDWCREVALPDGRFMNQGYLNSWPKRYANVAIIRHPGANLAAWNVRRHRIERVKGAILVEGRALIFFHFSGLKRHDDGRWSSGYTADLKSLPGVIAELYKPYLRKLETARREILASHGVSGTGSVRLDQKT